MNLPISDEARAIGTALLAAVDREPDPILSGMCRAGLHAECGGHGAVQGCGCMDASHTAPGG